MNFGATLLLSCFLLVQGLWWLIMSMNSYFVSKVPDRLTRRKLHFTARTWYRVPFCSLEKIPLEPVLRILISLISAAVYLSATNSWALSNRNGNIDSKTTSAFQLATVFVLFAILGCAEIMASYRKLQFPHAIPHIVLSIIYLAIGLVHYRSAFDTNPIIKGYCEILLFLAVLASFVTAIESFQMRDFALNFAKCFLTILQGTWLFQASFATLESKMWKGTEGNKELIPLTFLWHVLGLLIIYFILHCIMLSIINQNKKKQDALFNGNQSRHEIDEDSIPLGIVVHGNMLYNDNDTSDIDTLYP